jgi:hypothetical protein
MHIICMTYAGRMPAPQLFSIFGLYDLAAHQLITYLFPKSIHAVTYDGFLLKIEAFIFAFTLKQAFI